MAETYYNTNATFDINQFNKDFDEYLIKQKAKRVITEQRFLDSKTIETREKLLHELTFFELVVNMKNTLFDIMDDVISFNITLETFTKNNRLFYLGLLLLIFCVTLICINILFDDAEINDSIFKKVHLTEKSEGNTLNDE